MDDIKLYDKVKILKTGEEAFVVWISPDAEALGDEYDSYLLEIINKNEMPNFLYQK